MRVLILTAALFCYVTVLRAAGMKCAVCDQPIQGKFFLVDDKVESTKKTVCLDCGQLGTWCFLCNVPVKNQSTRLPDGRSFCQRDAREAILTEEAARVIWAETREDLKTIFSRFLTFPQANLSIGLVDKVHLEKTFKSPGYSRECGSIFGATQTRLADDDRFHHTISLLSGLKKTRMMAVLAHECAHAWIRENLKGPRKLSHDAEEGFCEWVAYKLMELRNDPAELKGITGNQYTRGQITVFLEADKEFGPYPIIEWVKMGMDGQVELAHLERIKFLQAKAVGPIAWELPAPQPARVAQTLILQGITGPPNRRLALINNCPLQVREEAKVQLGTSNVIIRVVEILEKSVIVHVNGTSERKELALVSKGGK